MELVITFFADDTQLYSTSGLKILMKSNIGFHLFCLI